jgi:hypothetical protein
LSLIGPLVGFQLPFERPAYPAGLDHDVRMFPRRRLQFGDHRITGSSTGGVTPPTSPAPVAKRLGGFPFWRGDEDFLDALAQAYQVETARGMEIYLSTLVP